MERTYDIFEVMPDGNLMWRTSSQGHERAIAGLKLWASKTKNEVRVMHVGTKSLIAALNVKPERPWES